MVDLLVIVRMAPPFGERLSIHAIVCKCLGRLDDEVWPGGRRSLAGIALRVPMRGRDHVSSLLVRTEDRDLMTASLRAKIDIDAKNRVHRTGDQRFDLVPFEAL